MSIVLNMNDAEASTFGRFVLEDPNEIASKLHAFQRWNRFDLAMQLYEKLSDAKKLNLFPTDYKPLVHRTIGSDEQLPARLNPPRKPLANPKHLTVHRRSVAAFLVAEPGHTFTGIAMVGHVTQSSTSTKIGQRVTTSTKLEGRPKIFLCPVQQGMITTRQNTSKSYAPKEHENPSVGIYKVRVSGAISHKNSDVHIQNDTQATIGAGTAAGHTQLSNLVKMKPKYASLTQEGGHFVGFTVCKGVSGGLWKNRYSMTSLSSNAGAFAGVSDDETEKLYPDKEWSDEIVRACDALLTLQADLECLNYDVHAVGGEILEGEAKTNDFWKSMKNTYWPCFNLAVITVGQEDDDDWDT
jgi:hypothetical protein